MEIRVSFGGGVWMAILIQLHIDGSHLNLVGTGRTLPDALRNLAELIQKMDAQANPKVEGR